MMYGDTNLIYVTRGKLRKFHKADVPHPSVLQQINWIWLTSRCGLSGLDGEWGYFFTEEQFIQKTSLPRRRCGLCFGLTEERETAWKGDWKKLSATTKDYRDALEEADKLVGKLSERCGKGDGDLYHSLWDIGDIITKALKGERT